MSRKFIVAASLVILSQASSNLHAEIEWCTESIVRTHSKAPVVKQNRSGLIKQAALFADASYNDTQVVKKKMISLRYQEGFKEREALKQNYKIVEFNATIPEGWLLDARGITPSGIVGYKDDGNSKPQLIIAFHGSECVEDFTMANLLLHNRTGKELGLEGNYHGGFYDRYMQGRSGMMNAIMQQLAEHGKKIEDVDMVVTGHSLGGALGTIAAADLKKNIAPAGRIHLVTFSSPEVMCSVGANSLQEQMGSGRILRVARDNDPVVLAPLDLLGYTHVGEEIILEAKTGISLENHNMKTILEDALSQASAKLIKFENITTKFFNKMKRLPGDLFNYGKSKVTGLFSK